MTVTLSIVSILLLLTLLFFLYRSSKVMDEMETRLLDTESELVAIYEAVLKARPGDINEYEAFNLNLIKNLELFFKSKNLL